jgi:hypothetical protein
MWVHHGSLEDQPRLMTRDGGEGDVSTSDPSQTPSEPPSKN